VWVGCLWRLALLWLLWSSLVGIVAIRVVRFVSVAGVVVDGVRVVVGMGDGIVVLCG